MMSNMINIHDILDNVMIQAVDKGNEYWIRKILNVDFGRIHIAIMVEPYLSYILNGKKTIESRISQKKSSPFKKVERKDIVILKKSGGDIEAVFEAGEVSFFEQLNPKKISEIKNAYNDKICGDEEFWKKKEGSTYATLIEIKSLFICRNIKTTGKNRQSWICWDNKYRNKLTVILSGKVASGKTYLSKYIAMLLSCRRYSVSDYLKHIAAIREQKDVSRQILQEIGKEQIELGWEMFVNNFLGFIDWNNNENIVIDGVRHIEFFNTLMEQIKPCKVVLVWVEIDENTMAIRMKKRNESGNFLGHVAEGNLEKIRQRADIVIVNGKEQESDSTRQLLYELYRCIYSHII